MFKGRIQIYLTKSFSNLCELSLEKFPPQRFMKYVKLSKTVLTYIYLAPVYHHISSQSNGNVCKSHITGFRTPVSDFPQNRSGECNTTLCWLTRECTVHIQSSVAMT